MLLLGRCPVTARTREALPTHALLVTAWATTDGISVWRLPVVDRIVGLLVRELLVMVLVIAEGLMLLGLAHVLALIGALLAEGACLRSVLRLLAVTFRWKGHRLGLSEADLCRRNHLHWMSVAVLSCLERRVVCLEGKLRGVA